MRSKYITIVLAASLSLNANAGEQEDRIVDQVIEAYGGTALTDMKSLIVKDRYKNITEDGGVRPGEASVSRLHSTLTVDYERGRKAVRNWSVTKAGKRLSQIMFDGTHGWSVNFLRGSHVVRPDLNGQNVGSGMMRLLDTAVARQLAESRSKAKLEETIQFNARPHTKLSFETRGGTVLTALIDAGTGLLSKLITPWGSEYLYSNYRQNSGVRYAYDTEVLSKGKVTMVTLSRNLEVNPPVEGAFSVPSDTKALEGMQDTSDMTVNKLGEDTYVVGKGFSSSIFVDAGDYYVGAGGLGGIKDRLQALNMKLGADKPLKFQTIPEHQGHLGGVQELVDLGVKLVTVESHVDGLKARLKQTTGLDGFEVVNEKASFADGKVEVHVIKTLQSDEYLLFYAVDSKTIFTLDEFGTQLLNSVPSADKNMISFRKEVERLELPVEHIAYTHGPGVLSMDDIRRVTDGYTEGRCPSGFEICQD